MNQHLLVDVLRFVTILGASLSAGGLLMVHVVIEPILRTFPAEKSLVLHQTWDIWPDTYMKPSMISAGIAGIVILILGPGLPALPALLTLGGICGSVGVALTSELGNVPINRKIHPFKPAAIPPEYLQLRNKWRMFNGIRVTLAVLGLLCYITAVAAR